MKRVILVAMVSLATGACGPEEPDCPAPLAVCGDTCVDVTRDEDHCGQCDNACDTASGLLLCEEGHCVCAPWLTDCSGTCVDTTSAPNNCGSCGNTCTGGKTCVSGTCECAIGWTDCSGTCVDTSTDPQNCGTCGNACGGASCTNGTC